MCVIHHSLSTCFKHHLLILPELHLGADCQPILFDLCVRPFKGCYVDDVIFTKYMHLSINKVRILQANNEITGWTEASAGASFCNVCAPLQTDFACSCSVGAMLALTFMTELELMVKGIKRYINYFIIKLRVTLLGNVGKFVPKVEGEEETQQNIKNTCDHDARCMSRSVGIQKIYTGVERSKYKILRMVNK